LSEESSNHQEQCRFSPPEDGTAGFAGPAIKEIRKESPGPELLVGYIYVVWARNLRIINIKVKVVGPGPPWCLAPCRPGLNQFKDQGNKCVSSGLAWMISGIKGINHANSGLAWVSCEHVGSRPWASTVPGTLQARPGKST